MNPPNVSMWCVYALAFACIVTYVSQGYEALMYRRQCKKNLKAIPAGLETFACNPKINQFVVQMATVRGYDSDELFREDLWLRRIAASRRKLATMELSICAGTLENQVRQLCAMLIQHAGATSNN
jgi:hypothetical protein